MKFLGKTIDTNQWHSGNTIMDWENGEISLGTTGDLQRVHAESVSYHFGDKDTIGKEVYTGHILKHHSTGETAAYAFDESRKAVIIITQYDTYLLYTLPPDFLQDYEIISHNFDIPKNATLLMDEQVATALEPIDPEAKEFQGAYYDDEKMFNGLDK